MSKTDTWMPLYIGDYMADTMKLNAAQHGAYLLIIIDYWRNGAPSDDDEELALIARTDLSEWKRKVGPKVRPYFEVRDGRLYHHRIERELERAGKNVAQRSAAGKASAEARKNKRNEQQTSNEQTTENQRAFNERSTSVDDTLQRNGRPSPSPSERKKEAATRERAEDPPRPQMPCRNDPPERWMHLANKAEISREGVKKPVRNGWYLDDVADLVCEAAKIRTESWRGDWRPLMAWLDDEIDVHQHILPAIKRCAERPNYVPPGSLKYFDSMVREEFARAAS